jgi:WD40 repeat protein
VTGAGDNAIRVFRENVAASGDASLAPTFDMAAVAYEAHDQDVNSVTWNPSDSSLLASCSDDGTVKLWTVENES